MYHNRAIDGGMDKMTFIFQQDNAQVYTAQKVMKFFEQENITVLPWPANPLDRNLIEHVCPYLKRMPIPYPEMPKCLDGLWEHVQYIWENMPDDDPYCKPFNARISHLIAFVSVPIALL
ncbi:hypothetical protein BGX23_004256 [Mortierella sp. AD031]|nr:hypothetical protein BGX23_004256 [Mortierella sp. AD031]